MFLADANELELLADRLELDSKPGEVTWCCCRGEWEEDDDEALIAFPPDAGVFGGAEFMASERDLIYEIFEQCRWCSRRRMFIESRIGGLSGPSRSSCATGRPHSSGNPVQTNGPFLAPFLSFRAVQEW